MSHHDSLDNRIHRAVADVIRRAQDQGFAIDDDDQATALAYVAAEAAITEAHRTPHKDDEDDRHIYTSTSCLHRQHSYCQSGEGVSTHGETWKKDPASCKYCKAPCICICHIDIHNREAVKHWMNERRKENPPERTPPKNMKEFQERQLERLTQTGKKNK